MDNLLTLHKLIGETKSKGGNTPLGRFKYVSTLNINDEVIKKLLVNDKYYIAVGSQGIMYSTVSDKKVYFVSLNDLNNPKAVDTINNSYSTGETIQLFSVKDGFIGIYKDNSSTSTTAQYTVKQYDGLGNFVRGKFIDVDESQHSNSAIRKVVQDPINEKIVFIFNLSWGSVPTYLVVTDKKLSPTKETFIEYKYSINTETRSYMAYDGWLYGQSASNNSLFCKFKYDTTDSIDKSYASFNTSHPQSYVADPKNQIAYDLVSGWSYRMDYMSIYLKTFGLYHHTSSEDVPMCINMSPNPDIGFILCAKGWELFEVNSRVPKLNPFDFAPMPEVRQMTEINYSRSWDYCKILTSYDSKNLISIGYNKDSNYTNTIYLYRR
ncbi:hypothetical protein FDC23_13785 [Clostridium botulinum]|nr:hypothetical protein [Clostridium botulinum]NFN91464.1 hypothetical protein [Clostridium botulinum]